MERKMRRGNSLLRHGKRALMLIVPALLAVAAGTPAQAKEQLRFCTKEYAPVCALAPVRCVRAPCPAGVRRTFGNACEARVAGATILHRGRCRKPGLVMPPVVRPGFGFCRRWEVKSVCKRRRPGGRAICRTVSRRCLRWF